MSRGHVIGLCGRVQMPQTTRVNKSCPICEWVMSHMWMSHVPYVNESCHTCEWVTSHKCSSLVTVLRDRVQIPPTTRVNQRCPIYKWVMSHMRTSHVAHVNESCHTCERVMSQGYVVLFKCHELCGRMRHVPCVSESCHTRKYVCGWVMSHMWTSHVTGLRGVIQMPRTTGGVVSLHMRAVCWTHSWRLRQCAARQHPSA